MMDRSGSSRLFVLLGRFGSTSGYGSLGIRRASGVRLGGDDSRRALERAASAHCLHGACQHDAQLKREREEARLERWEEDASPQHRRDGALDPLVRRLGVERLEHRGLVEPVDESREPGDAAFVDPLEAAEVLGVDSPL